MKPMYIAELFKFGSIPVATLQAQELKKDALEAAEQSDFNFDYAEVKTVYMRGGEQIG